MDDLAVLEDQPAPWRAFPRTETPGEDYMSTEIRVAEIEDAGGGARLTHWLKKVGDVVQSGDQIAEVETEKAAIEVIAPAAGRISKILVQEGTSVMPGTPVALLEDVDAKAQVSAGGAAPAVKSLSYDLVLIGSGPGGYVCAIRAAQLGLKVAVVEKRATYGGTCLNVGCIPSKTLLYASEIFEEVTRDFDTLGIEVGKPGLNLDKMMLHKSKTVEATVKGVAYLFRKNKIDGYHGTGRFLEAGRVEVSLDSGEKLLLLAKNVVIATGSIAAQLHGIEVDEKRVVTSDTAIAFPSVPPRLLVIGAGSIGLELGSVWQRLGSQVTIVEYLDHILPGIDHELATMFQRMTQKTGTAFRLSTKVTAIDSSSPKELKITVEPAKGGSAETLLADAVLVAVGRIPFTENLGLDVIGVKLDERGRVKTDQQYRTNVAGVWAIGDVIAGPMLAHKAEEEGVAAAENIAGLSGHVNYGAIPAVVYTRPEIAAVGKTEEELKQEGIEYEAGRFPFTANGRARAMLKTDGLVKILAEKGGGRVLGAHILGASAGELIAELTLAIQTSATAEQLASTCHAHPTLSEAVHEAALGTMERRINI